MTEFVEMPLLPSSDAGDGGKFDYTVAEAVKSAFTTAASTIDGQAGSRASYVSTAGEEFKGHFSEVFAANAKTAASDATRLAEAMRTAAGYIGQMITAAEDEDARRKKNNEWVREHNDRNWLEKGWDSVFGEEERPNIEKQPGPTFTSGPVTPAPKQEYTPGGAGGTSSAKPENLRSFATGAAGLDDALAGEPGKLDTQLSNFASSCYWGSLDAAGVVTAYKQYLDANKKDVEWAKTIADAFKAAGGEGNVSNVSDAALNEALKAAGVGASRSALDIPQPTAAGAMPSTGYADDPVNTATGNFIEPETDLGFAGLASGASLTRMYNSLGSGLGEGPGAGGVFGPGWSSVLDQLLRLDGEGAAWVMADGREVAFDREGSGWARAVGENLWLAAEPASSGAFAGLGSVPSGTNELLVVRNNEGGWWAFTPAGLWLGAGVGVGRTVSVHRDAEGAVSSLVHERGRGFSVEYAGGRVAVVVSSDGRRVEYVYDASGYLVGVVTEAGTRSYRINEAGLIDQVMAATGVVEATNTYDEAGRVVTQLSQHGRLTRFAYLPGRVTVTSDVDGARSNTWVADARGRLVGVLDAQDRRQSMSYDAQGNQVSLTERDGSVTVHAYDSRGHRVRTVTPEGGDISYAYDGQDRIVTVVTEGGGVIEYEYADDLSRDPSLIRDALGGVTRLEWVGGLLVSVVDPTGVLLRFEHDEFGDLVATINAVGDTARLVRDHAGRVIEAVSPSGAVTRFDYDLAGNLVSRVDADGALWRFEHDGAGRPVASIDPAGARIGLEYGANGELVATTDALGRRVERVFDDLGNVASTVLPGGAVWGFEHDALSRLVGITDPAGGVWGREYDELGNLSAVVDPTGVRVDASTDRRAGTATLRDAFASSQVKADRYGRPTQVVAEDGSAELITYNAAGQPVELLDGEGGLTILRRDTAGRVIETITPSGASTRFEYDVCGRPWRSTAPDGAVTELVYDADQRVIARLLPGGGKDVFEYDPAGRLLAHRCADGTLARYGYDKVGRLSFAQDTWFGTRRFGYNLAGELVSTTNGVGGKTVFEYDERSRLIKVTDPTGASTTRTYTELDKVASSTDALGRVTTATYDAAGRQLSQTDPEGNTTTFTYDAAGREESVSVNGALVSSMRRDALARTITITDHTRADGDVVEHELVFNARGQLLSRTRGGQGLSWEYDKDGYRVAFTDANGTTTTYERDAAGRVTAVANPRLGKAVFAYNEAGQLASSRVGEGLGALVQEWVYRNGALSEHTRTTVGAEAEAATTLIGRDVDGRIASITTTTDHTSYAYDDAGQLVAAQVKDLATGTTTQSNWVFDEGGRLLSETRPDGSQTNYAYDQAGQLTTTTGVGGMTRFAYDGLGRRSRVIGEDGSWEQYTWGPLGYLEEHSTHTPDGETTTEQTLWVDALGELAGVNGENIWWDTANSMPSLAGVGAEQVLTLPGGLTGVGEAWLAPGWRGTRATDTADPWAMIGAPTIPNPTNTDAMSSMAVPAGAAAGVLGAGVQVSATGSLGVAGLEWLGARAYDPSTRAFLSTDPLAPALGAGWDGNPYAYAGNNPLAFSDPNGLKPLTDEELKAYDASSRGAVQAVGKWLGENWEYIVAGAAIVVGVGLMFTGVGGPVGMVLIGAASGALISGGASVITQKASNGTVDWGKVGIDAAVGALGGAVGGGAAFGLARGANAARAAVMSGSSSKVASIAAERLATTGARSVVAGGASGATSNTAAYAWDPDVKDHTLGGYVQAFGSGALTGAGGSAATAKLGSLASGWGARITPNWTSAVTSGSRGLPYNWGGIVGDQLADHALGTGVGLLNTALQPGGADREDLWNGAIQGFVQGAGAPSAGRHGG